MADLSTKKDPLDIPDESPDYAQDKTGEAGDENVQPHVGTDPQSLPAEGTQKPTIHLDEDKVARHERGDDSAA